MKKKILFRLGMLAVAAALAVNVNIARNDRNVTLSLEQLGAAAQAQAEGGSSCGVDGIIHLKCVIIGVMVLFVMEQLVGFTARISNIYHNNSNNFD